MFSSSFITFPASVGLLLAIALSCALAVLRAVAQVWDLRRALRVLLPLNLQAPDGLLLRGRFDFVREDAVHSLGPQVTPADRQRQASIRHMQHSSSLAAA